MCGIVGFVGAGDRPALARATRALEHRGPDDEGLEWFDPLGSGLGHRRLSILDLSDAGHQPMADGDAWIVYNGEIYNHAELREELVGLGHRFRSRSDTEVLLHAYRAWGERCLDRLNGMFAFAILDARTGALFAARDRLGIKPFYYHHDGEKLVFASEIKALLASGLAPRAPDLVALHTPTRFQLSPYTGFDRILKLPPGSLLRFERGRLEVRRWYTLAPTEEEGAAATAHADVAELLEDAVRLQMLADVPVGALLSGGLDSSLICALMRPRSAGPLHSFTIRFSDADQRFEKADDDSVYARRVAARLGFEHHELEVRPDLVDLLPRMVWHLDEPLSDPAALNTYLIARAARDLGIPVLLSGIGGDEVFGGYRTYLACLAAETYHALVPAIARRALERLAEAVPVASRSQGYRTLRWSKRFLSFASLPPVQRFLASDLSWGAEDYRACFRGGPAYDETFFVRAQQENLEGGALHYLTRMCLADTRAFLPEHNLTYSDKASMAAGVEIRPPLIDHRVVERMFRLPPRFRIRGRTQKVLLKEIALRWLERDVVERPKASFASPIRAWLRGALAPMVDDLLSPDRVRARGLYDPVHVERLVRRDRDGLEDNALTIWMLLTSEVWFQTFF